MIMNILRKIPDPILKVLLFCLPYAIIFIFSRNILFNLPNPSWGDMTAMPQVPIPFDHLFYPWQDIYDGIFGGQYMPHFISSYLIGIISPTVLQYIYLFLIFPVIAFSFLDFFKITLKKKSLFDIESLVLANILTLIIYFSNIFVVNFLQGNPDVYYPYLLGIPGVLYLYLFIRYRHFLSILKLALIITLAMWVGFFALYYMGILLLPFFILFTILYVRKDIKKFILSLVVFILFIVLNNLPYIFMSLKPILSAVQKVSTGLSSSGLSVDEFFSLYRSINPLNLFYFSGNAGDYTWILFNIPGGDIYTSNPAFALLLFQLIVVIAVLIFGSRTIRTKEIRLLLYGLFGVFLLFFTIILIWDTQIFYEFARNVPLVPLFRNPKKLMLSLFVAYMILVVFMRFYSSRKVYFSLISTILFLNIVSVIPLISDGYNGLENSYKTALRTYGVNADPKESFYAYAGFPVRYMGLKLLLNELDKKDKEYHYRVIFFPDNSQQLYGSHLRYLFNPFFISPLQAVWGDLDQRINVMDSFYDTVLGENTANPASVLRIMNVKYVVIDRKSPYKLFTNDPKPQTRVYYGTYTTGNPEEFYKLLKDNEYFELAAENEDFYVLKVNAFKESSLYIPSQPCMIQQVGSESCDLFVTDSHLLQTNNSVTVSEQKIINPTRYVVTLSANSSSETTLFFSQSFDDAWKVQPIDGNKVEIIDHTIGNLFGNVWKLRLPRQGEYMFEIVYSWQKSYTIMILISFVAIGINILLLMTYPYWKKWILHTNNEK